MRWSSLRWLVHPTEVQDMAAWEAARCKHGVDVLGDEQKAAVLVARDGRCEIFGEGCGILGVSNSVHAFSSAAARCFAASQVGRMQAWLMVRILASGLDASEWAEQLSQIRMGWTKKNAKIFAFLLLEEDRFVQSSRSISSRVLPDDD
jgi:hypothetical protein